MQCVAVQLNAAVLVAGAPRRRRAGAGRRRVPRRAALARRLPAALLPAALRARAPRQPAPPATGATHVYSLIDGVLELIVMRYSFR